MIFMRPILIKFGFRNFATVLALTGLALALSACGREKKVEVDAQFDSQVTTFKKLSNGSAQIDDLVVKFGDTGSPRARGVCKLSDDAPPTVVINKATWDVISDEEREELILHELGHCVLKRKHKDATRPDGAPESIMYPYSMLPEEYEKYKVEYHEELFTHGG